MRALGIDCGQLKHRFCLLDEGGRVLAEGALAESRQGLQRLRAVVGAHGEPQVVIMEASGNYWQNLFAELQGWGWSPKAVDPQRAAQFARLHSPRHKTDRADATALAQLGLSGVGRGSFQPTTEGTLARALARAIKQRSMLLNQLHSLVVVANPGLLRCRWRLGAARSLAVLQRYPTTKELRRARGLARVRFGPRHRVGEKAAAGLQQASREALCGALSPAHPPQIRFLVTQLLALAEEIRRLQAELVARLPQAQVLTSIPGVGERTAVMVAACVPLTELASAKQAAAFVGLHPHLIQSGQSCRSRLSKRGDATARLVLYQAALPLVSQNPHFAAFYHRLRSRGLKAKQALCAVAHKLVRVCYALMKTQTVFSPNYQQLALPIT